MGVVDPSAPLPASDGNRDRPPRGGRKPFDKHGNIRILLGVLALVVLSILCSAATSNASSGNAGASATRRPAMATPPQPVSAQQALADSISQQFNASDAGEQRVTTNQLNSDGTYQLNWQISDNRTKGLARIMAKMDVLNVIRAVKQSRIPVRQLVMVGSFPMADVHGNLSVQPVVRLVYSAATLNKINVDGLDFDRAFDAADQSNIAPGF